MVRRGLAVGTVALTGAGLLAGAVVSYPSDGAGLPATALVGLGVTLGLAIVAGAGYLYRSDVRTDHTLRIAGWNALGVALLGGVLLVATRASNVSIPGYVVVDVLGVSSVAHLLIGYNDVRRIRAQELARQRRTLAVVNRLTRHNLRNRTQVLTAHAEALADAVDDPDARDRAETVSETSNDLADIHGELTVIQDALNQDPPEGARALEDIVNEVLEPYREAHPDGEFDVDVPADLQVRADDQFVTALDHLVENAVEHGSPDDVFVAVRGRREDSQASVRVTDRGPGVPESEVTVLNGEREIGQLKHSTGLGLWVAKTVAERHGGDLFIENDDEGATVTLTAPAA